MITNHYRYGGALMLNQFTPFLAIVTLSSTMQITVYNIFLTSMWHHEHLNWPKFKQVWQELLRIENCVQHYSVTLSSTFVQVSLAFSWFFNYAFIEFHGPLQVSRPMKYIPGCHCLFRDREMYQSKFYDPWKSMFMVL